MKSSMLYYPYIFEILATTTQQCHLDKISPLFLIKSHRKSIYQITRILKTVTPF